MKIERKEGRGKMAEGREKKERIELRSVFILNCVACLLTLGFEWRIMKIYCRNYEKGNTVFRRHYAAQ
jgi:hypothetical protein